jgi:hypothetical protein
MWVPGYAAPTITVTRCSPSRCGDWHDRAAASLPGL